MTTFLLIRHGMTDAVGRYYSGRLPGVPLNHDGRAQAQALAERLQPVPIGAVVSSPLERARETAAPIAASHNLAVDIEPLVNEYDVGEWTGASFDALSQDPRWAVFNQARSQHAAPGGERMADVQRRAISALTALAARNPERVVAVVSHADVIRAVLLFFLEIPIDSYWRLDVDPARLSIVEVDDGWSRIRQVNGDNASLLL